jgi:predicted acetyltransferase
MDMGLLTGLSTLNLQYRPELNRIFASIMPDNFFKLYRNPKLFTDFAKLHQTRTAQLRIGNAPFSYLLHDTNLALL